MVLLFKFITVGSFSLKFTTAYDSPLWGNFKVNIIEKQLSDDYICTIEPHPQYFTHNLHLYHIFNIILHSGYISTLTCSHYTYYNKCACTRARTHTPCMHAYMHDIVPYITQCTLHYTCTNTLTHYTEWLTWFIVEGDIKTHPQTGWTSVL